MKRNVMIAGAGAIMVAVALIGGTMAANNAQTAKAAQAEISVNGLDGGIAVSTTDPVFDSEQGIAAVPGGDYKIARHAVNDGNLVDYDAYFKAVIYKSWMDRTEEYIDVTETEVLEDRPYIGEGESRVYLDEVAVGDVVNGWLVAYVDDEEIELFYTQKVAPKAATTNFIDGIAFSEELSNKFTNAMYGIEFEVTAVQANDGEDAIASALGYYPVIDETGNIVSVSEEKP